VILLWLPIAAEERFEQLDYIAQDNPFAAITQDEEIEQQISLLVLQPEMGRVGRVKGTRELVITHTPFIVVYRIKGERIEILRFLHGAQKWPKKSKSKP
jgi:toxin ParE1/3/4